MPTLKGEFKVTDLFKDIPDEIIMKTLDTIRKNLSDVGLYGGHTLYRHVGIDPDSLKARLDGSNKIEVASSFYNISITKKVVTIMMTTFFDSKIREWLFASLDDCMTLYMQFNKAVGYGYKKGQEQQLCKLNKACLVLIKDERADWGFRILTSCPIVRNIYV